MSVLTARVLVARTHLEATRRIAQERIQADPDFAEAVMRTIEHTLNALDEFALELETRDRVLQLRPRSR